MRWLRQRLWLAINVLAIASRFCTGGRAGHDSVRTRLADRERRVRAAAMPSKTEPAPSPIKP
jgi:hypothetical protein